MKALPQRVQKKVLYVESNTDGTVGGSHFSLLLLLEGLNKKIYSPVVIFYQEHRLIPRFQQADCRVLLLTKRKPLDISEYFPRMKTKSNNRIIYLFLIIPLLIFQKGINYFKTFVLPTFNCWQILRRENISLIHLNNTLLRPQEWIFASLFTKARIIAHERGINNFFPFHSRFWARFLKAIICISDAVKNNLLKYGFPEKQLSRIYNGLDPNKFAVTVSKEEILKELGVEKDCPIIGIVGNIKPWKGQETVVGSMKYVQKAFPNIKCLIIGGVSPNDRAYLVHLESIVKNENLNDCILFTGQRNDIANLINSLTVLIHASVLPEPFGRVLLEGMAMNKPVITNNIGAGQEIVVDGKTGLIVNRGDPHCLAEAIISLLQNRKKALEMGRNGYDRLTEHFHASHYVKQIEDLYAKILN